MIKHIKTVAILWIVSAVLSCGTGLLVGGIGAVAYLAKDAAIEQAERDADRRGDTFTDQERDELTMVMMGVFAFYGCLGLGIGFGGFLEIIMAWGLMKYKGWARILTFILSAVSLLSFPLGTALGVYSIMVMLDADVSQAFAQGGVFDDDGEPVPA